MRNILLALLLVAVPAAGYAGEAEAVRDTNWCFEAQTKDTLLEQSGRSGMCAALLTGGLAAVWFGAIDPSVIGSVMTKRQNELANIAADAACIKTGPSDQVAVRLIQVCECHNEDAVKNIENNQTQVLETLRARRGC